MTAVLFDLDGTLMDTPRVIIHSLRHVLGALGDPYADAQLSAQVGRPLDAIMADLFPQASGLEIAEKKQAFREAFRAATVPDAQHLVFDHIRELLNQLADEGIPMAIVTSKVTASALELLAAGRLRDFFAVVIGHDQAAVGKPAPDLALLAASRLGSEPSQCIVVGDSPDDMRMGAAGGMHTIGVTWGASDRNGLYSSGASSIAACPEQLHANIFALAREIRGVPTAVCEGLTHGPRSLRSTPSPG